MGSDSEEKESDRGARESILRFFETPKKSQRSQADPPTTPRKRARGRQSSSDEDDGQQGASNGNTSKRRIPSKCRNVIAKMSTHGQRFNSFQTHFSLRGCMILASDCLREM